MSYGHGIEITGAIKDRFDEILTPEAVGLVAKLQRELIPRRAELLAARARRQQDLIAGATWTSCLTPSTSGRTGPGGSLPRPLAWSTAGWRSPGRPTRR